MFSNATPFLQKIDTGYVCCYCREQFQDPADLKKHNQEIHGDKYDPVSPNVIMNSRKAEFCIKLDITGLQCKLCNKDIPSLEDLKDHLQNEHKKKIFTDIKNKIIPFKFETEDIRCCICSNVFEKFRKLQEHMHSHYRNYVCEQCDLGFVTLLSLKSHAEKHKLGEFKCQFCPKIYDTYRKKKSHEKAVHITGYLLSRCGYCNERFTSTKNKDEHLAKVHGVEIRALKCQACDRTFENKRALTIHTRRDHLMERKHKCSQCEMSFFNSSSLKMHIVAHSGLKNFQCDMCQKSYAQKKTLTQHMRVHSDERRYKCELCGQAFVRKYSFNTHMKNKHGDK